MDWPFHLLSGPLLWRVFGDQPREVLVVLVMLLCSDSASNNELDLSQLVSLVLPRPWRSVVALVSELLKHPNWFCFTSHLRQGTLRLLLHHTKPLLNYESNAMLQRFQIPSFLPNFNPRSGWSTMGSVACHLFCKGRLQVQCSTSCPKKHK